MSETYGKPTAKKVRGCGWWLPAISTRFGPVPLYDGERQDSPSKAKTVAKRILAARLAAPNEKEPVDGGAG